MLNFDKLIDNYVYQKNKPKDKGRYYPSEIGNCLRKVWYTYKHPTEIEPDLRKIFEVGNILHDFIVEVIRSEKNPEVELVKAEMPVKLEIDGFLISGRVDDVVLVNSNGKMILVEVKSTKSLSNVNKPSPNHVMQLQFYMHASGIKNGMILYVEKYDLKTKSFETNYDQKQAEAIIDRFKILHHHVSTDDIPHAEAKKIDDMRWMCAFCDYKDRCDKE